MINDIMRKFAATLLLGVSLLAGCATDEPYDELGPGQNPGDDGTVTISLNVPTPRTVGTYAMTAKQECDIVTVDVLVFNPDGEFLYREKGTGIADGSADNKKTFSVKIKKTANPNNVTAFVYANVREQIDAALEDWLTEGSTTKADVIKKLVFDLPIDDTEEGQGGKWLVLPGRYTRFPMWGQTATIDLTKSSITIPEVNLLRSVAKIDVGLAFPTTGTAAENDVAVGLENFFLEEFYLYNASNKLQVAPTVGNLNVTSVTAPSIPDDGVGVFGTAASPIKYARRSYNAEGYKSFMNEIYLAEHLKGNNDDRPNNTCIVVGGRFGNKTAPVTYYRIDMVKTTYGSNGEATAQEYLDILRNHRYKVNITAVHARGFDTPREAFDAMGLNTNLTVVITSEDERVTNVVYDGQYMLGVDRTTVDVDNREHTGKQIYINTDYPEGWKATVSEDAADWLTLDEATGAAADATGGTYLEYTVAAYTGTSPRTGTITLQAGRLFMDITVTQSPIADIELVNVQNQYIMDGRQYAFWVKSNYNYKVRVEDDEYNIIEEFDPSGAKNLSATAYNFTLVDNHRMQEAALWNKTAKLVFYSETDEFDPAEVTIKGMDCFNIDGWKVYPYDQPTEKTWYVYANVLDSENNTAIPGPGMAGQQDPPREFSCAALGNNNWRLPTKDELEVIAGVVSKDQATMVDYYNFTAKNYWSATSYNSSVAYNVNVSSGTTYYNNSKTTTTNYARCVIVNYFKIAGLDVYREDQPTGKTWHVYANNDGADRNNVAGPGAEGQQDPALEFSCAALWSDTGQPWRLPTRVELENISAVAKNNLVYYNFNNTNYWSATSSDNTNAYYVVVSSGTTIHNGSKTSTTNYARCVRTQEPFRIAGLDVYPIDQPLSKTWYVYANVLDGETSTNEQGPNATEQQDPAREFSCAALPSDGQPWRLPTRDELVAISAVAKNSLVYYNFVSGKYYWSATSNSSSNAYYVNVSSGTTSNNASKTNTNNYARCVRSI